MAMNMSLASSVSSTGNNRSALFMSPSSIGTLGSPSPHHGTTPNPNNTSSHTHLELDVHWDPAAIRPELHMATILLSQRCLKQSAKWAAEQLLGLPMDGTDPMMPESPTKDNNTTNTAAATSNANAEPLSRSQHMQLLLGHETDPNVLYAKSLLELGDYGHAASVLSLPNHMIVTSVAPPLPNLSSYGIYLRAYAMFLAGERRKEEDYIELQSEVQKQSFARNPYLSQLCQELQQAHRDQCLDAFGLYVYGMALKEAQACNLALSGHPPAHFLLMESVLQFPCNWSAWLDLAQVALAESANNTKEGNAQSVEQAIEQHLLPKLGGHYMYHFFCAHLLTAQQAHEDAMMLYDHLMEPAPGSIVFQSPYLVGKLGVLHYHLRQFGQSRACFQQLHAKDPFRMDDLDVYSNVLYVEEDRVGLSQLAHSAIKVDKYRPETCCIVGNYYSLKQQRSKAVMYFQRALKLDRNYMSAWTLMGHEYVELKNTAAAMEAYRRAVHLSPNDYRAWYGLGQTYEFLNMHLYALYYYRKAVTLRPFDARMWCAMGLCYLALHRTTDAIRSYERAVNQGDTEGIATQKLAALYRQQNDFEKAAQCYLRHLELRYLVTNPHPDAAAISSSGVANAPGQPSLDDIVQRVVVEAPEAEALLFLSGYHKDHGEFDTAALFCSRLLEYPGPEKEEAKALLRELRSRKSQTPVNQPRRPHTRSHGPPLPPWKMDESKDGPGADSSYEFSP